MFDIGWGEFLLIGVVALIAIGPKELPGALRTLGQWMGKVRRMAGDFQNQFHEALREAELHDLKKEVDDVATKASHYANLDPLEDVRRDIESAVSGGTSTPPPVTPPTDIAPSVDTPLPLPAEPALLPPPETAALPPPAAAPQSPVDAVAARASGAEKPAA